MTAKSTDYVNGVLDFTMLQNLSDSKVEKIAFKSELQSDRKENEPLKSLISKYSNELSKYEWSIKYEYFIEQTHNLIFTNNSIIETEQKSNMKNTSSQQDINIKTLKQSELASYFLQVTSVDFDYFHIEIQTDKHCDKKRRLFIKEIDGTESTKIESAFTIRKGQMSAGIDININDVHDKLYHFALYESKSAQTPLDNSNKVQLIVVKNENNLPPINKYYKPKCIDVLSMLKAVDNENKKLNLYWSIPSQLFGDITYKIINNETKEEEIILSLPYSINFSYIPISFKVTTMAEIDTVIYESIPSQTIAINDFALNDYLPISVQQCNTKQLILLLNQPFNSDSMLPYKDVIKSYLHQHKINGAILMKMGREQFCDDLIKYCKDPNINASAMEIYRQFTKLEFCKISNVTEKHEQKMDLLGVESKIEDTDQIEQKIKLEKENKELKNENKELKNKIKQMHEEQNKTIAT
eukprot:144094_1